MRVTFDSFSNTSVALLNRDATTQGLLTQKISSGENITSADQNPLEAQTILSLQSTGAQTQQFYNNATYALNVSTASYSAVKELSTVSDTAGELAAGTSALTTPEEFSANGTEVNGLIEEAVTSANQQFNGQHLLGGTETSTPPFTVVRDSQGQVTSVAYTGAAQGASIQVAPGSSVSPFPDGTSNSAVAGFINQLVSLRTAFQNNDATSVAAQVPGLQSSEDSILNTLGSLGAQQNSLQMTQNAATTSYSNTASTIGQLNDVNLAEASVELTQSQTAYQAGLQATAKIMSQSLLNYIT